MKKLTVLLTLFLFFHVNENKAQTTLDKSGKKIELPAKPSIYDYSEYYKKVFPNDTSEGSLKASIEKDMLIWRERLFPNGKASLMANAITDYVKDFNENGNSGCISGNWTSLGPHNKPSGSDGGRGMGQIHALKFSPNYNTDNTVYAGSNWGGLWRRIGANDWEELGTDTQLAFSSVTDIVIDPDDPSIIYITTGEADRTMGHYAQNPNGTPSEFTPLFTAGVYRTTDGGDTWESINGTDEALLDHFANGGTIRRILMHPDSSQVLYIASSVGIFKTTNATVANPVWIKLSNAPIDFEYKGFEFKPLHPQTLYASGKDIYRSTNSGSTWSSITGPGTGLDLNNLPDTFRVQRINIAVTPDDSNRIFAYIVGIDYNTPMTPDVPKLFLYMYNGSSWNLLYSLETSDAYEGITPQRTAIAASPTNSDEVYFGTAILYGGRNVTSSVIEQSGYNSGNFHADVHALAFEPNRDSLFCGTDGGVHIKRLANQGTAGITDISNGLAVVTPYGFDDTEDRTDRIMMGNQDTGTVIYENGQWKHIWGGDGYNGKIDIKTGIGFGGVNDPGGSIFSYNFNTQNLQYEWTTIPDLIPTDPTTNSNAWMRSTYDMINHPASERMYFTFSELYERLKSAQSTFSDNDATMWKLRSDAGKIVPEQWKRQLIGEVDIAMSNPNYMLLGLSGYVSDPPPGYPSGNPFVVQPRLLRSITGGCNGLTGFNADTCFFDITQKLIASGVHNSSYQPINPVPGDSAIIPIITGITFHPENHLKAWVTFTGYEPTAKVWYTEDGGETWENADDSQSLHNLPINDIVYQRGSNDRLYIATDAGIYYKDASMSAWNKFCDFPNVRVMELKINYCMGKLRAATFGRGVWEGDLLASNGTIGSAELVIDTITVWDKSRGLDRNLRIKAGAKLTIQGTSIEQTVISMPKDGKIIIEKGAELEVKYVTITNNCGQQWKGIEVHGDPTKTQTASNQGTLRLRRSILSNAGNAVTTSQNGYGNTGGGIIYADTATFRNNRRSVEFLQYNIADNISYFSNCTFELDTNYKQTTYIGHVTIWDNYGIPFTTCTFRNLSTTVSDKKYGIYTIDAGYQALTGCSFTGFTGGIYSTNSSSSQTFSVSTSTFSNNALGIYAGSVNGISATYNTFNVGEYRTSAYNHGVFVSHSTSYTVQHNTFNGSSATLTPQPVGVLCFNTGDASNVIRDNTYTGLYAANKSDGDNRNTSIPANGLRYLCNLNNSNHSYDFLVAIDPTMTSALSGIATPQGSSSSAAGNTFSLLSTPTGSDFNNLSNYTTQYYYRNVSGENPANTTGITKTLTSGSPGCSSSFARSSGSLSSDELLALQNEYNAAKTSYNNDVQTRNKKIDNGDTKALLTAIDKAVSTTTTALEVQLLGISPWLSAEVLERVLDKKNAFTTSFIQKILAANPDALYNFVVQQKMQNTLTAEQLNEVKVAQTNSTERSALESRLAQAGTNMSTSSNAIIHHYLVTTPVDLKKVREWLYNKNDLESTYQIVESWLQEKNTKEAQKVLNDIVTQFKLTDQQQKLYEDYRTITDLKVKAMEQGRSIADFNEVEVLALVELADHKLGRAAEQAKGILNFFYGYQYVTQQLPFPTKTAESKVQNVVPIMEKASLHIPSSVQVVPNPASDEVIFKYNLEGQEIRKGTLQVVDFTGKALQQFDFQDNTGEIRWSVNHLAPGLYFYSLKNGGRIVAFGKLVVNK